jgi:hypothetical protein
VWPKPKSIKKYMKGGAEVVYPKLYEIKMSSKWVRAVLMDR